jgi:hypothetical protein
MWDSATGQVQVYYQEPNLTWRKYPDANTDQSNVTIAPGTIITLTKREAVAGAATFLQSQMPYATD